MRSRRRTLRRDGLGSPRRLWSPAFLYLIVLLVGMGVGVAGLIELKDFPSRKAVLPALSGFLSEGEERFLRQGAGLLGGLAPHRIVETAIPMFAGGQIGERMSLSWFGGGIRSFMFAVTNMNLSDPATFLTVGIPGFSPPNEAALPVARFAKMDRGSHAPSAPTRETPRLPDERDTAPGFPAPPSHSSEPVTPVAPPKPLPSEPGVVRHRGPTKGWGDKPLVFIYHSHSSEAYRLTSGADHVWGSDEGVITVGDALAKALSEQYNIPVIHSRKIHDYPVWREAYNNSQKTVCEALQEFPSIEMVLDIHRDAATSVSGGPASIEIDGRKAARVFVVVTTDKFGLPHPNWRENLAFAYYLNAKMDEMYPGLSRGINIRDDARWNQHVHSRAVILEIGSEENTRQEAEVSASYLADVIACVLEDLQR